MRVPWIFRQPLGQGDPVVLVLSPHGTHWRRERWISKGAHRNHDQVGESIVRPVDRGAALRAEGEVRVRPASEPRVNLLASPSTFTCSHSKKEFTEKALPLRF